MRTHWIDKSKQAYNRERLADMLFEGVSAMSLQLDQRQFDLLLDYQSLLHKWNGVYNLTAVRDPEAMVRQHLLDSLAAVTALENAVRVLDVGSGGGLPGIVLAIARPELRVDLIDTVQKKTAFLNQVRVELGLENVQVHAGRVENLEVGTPFDTITSRAFSSLADLVQLSQHVLAPGGRYIAMKGLVPDEEIEELPPGWCVSEIRPIKVAGLDAARHLIIMERKNP